MADKFLVSRPAGNRIMNLADDDLRENARTIKASLEVEHSPFDGSDEVDGKHTYVTLSEQGADIAQVADRIAVYGKEVGGVTELFTRDSDGNILQITSAGEAFALATALHRDAGATIAERRMLATLHFANATTIRSRDNADAADLIMMLLDASDVLSLGESVAGTIQKLRLKLASDVADKENQLLFEYGSGDKKIWHEGNDGDGSGLDADLLGGFANATFLSENLGTYFESIGNTVGISGTGGSAAHGLGSTPRLTLANLRCITDDEQYVEDDVIPIAGNFAIDNGQGLMLWANDTDIGYQGAAGSGALVFLSRTDGNFRTLTHASWLLDMYAWK